MQGVKYVEAYDQDHMPEISKTFSLLSSQEEGNRDVVAASLKCLIRNIKYGMPSFRNPIIVFKLITMACSKNFKLLNTKEIYLTSTAIAYLMMKSANESNNPIDHLVYDVKLQLESLLNEKIKAETVITLKSLCYHITTLVSASNATGKAISNCCLHGQIINHGNEIENNAINVQEFDQDKYLVVFFFYYLLLKLAQITENSSINFSKYRNDIEKQYIIKDIDAFQEFHFKCKVHFGFGYDFLVSAMIITGISMRQGLVNDTNRSCYNSSTFRKLIDECVIKSEYLQILKIGLQKFKRKNIKIPKDDMKYCFEKLSLIEEKIEQGYVDDYTFICSILLPKYDCPIDKFITIAKNRDLYKKPEIMTSIIKRVSICELLFKAPINNNGSLFVNSLYKSFENVKNAENYEFYRLLKLYKAYQLSNNNPISQSFKVLRYMKQPSLMYTAYNSLIQMKTEDQTTYVNVMQMYSYRDQLFYYLLFNWVPETPEKIVDVSLHINNKGDAKIQFITFIRSLLYDVKKMDYILANQLDNIFNIFKLFEEIDNMHMTDYYLNMLHIALCITYCICFTPQIKKYDCLIMIQPSSECMHCGSIIEWKNLAAWIKCKTCLNYSPVVVMPYFQQLSFPISRSSCVQCVFFLKNYKYSYVKCDKLYSNIVISISTTTNFKSRIKAFITSTIPKMEDYISKYTLHKNRHLGLLYSYLIKTILWIGEHSWQNKVDYAEYIKMIKGISKLTFKTYPHPLNLQLALEAIQKTFLDFLPAEWKCVKNA